jgi:hypothetical protein
VKQMKYWNTRVLFLYISNHLIRLIHTHKHDSGGREGITEREKKKNRRHKKRSLSIILSF